MFCLDLTKTISFTPPARGFSLMLFSILWQIFVVLEGYSDIQIDGSGIDDEQIAVQILEIKIYILHESLLSTSASASASTSTPAPASTPLHN